MHPDLRRAEAILRRHGIEWPLKGHDQRAVDSSSRDQRRVIESCSDLREGNNVPAAADPVPEVTASGHGRRYTRPNLSGAAVRE